jgi:hypothetical protein
MPTEPSGWKFRLITDEQNRPVAVAYSFPDNRVATPAEIAGLMRQTVARFVSSADAADGVEAARAHRERADAVERGDLPLLQEPYSQS